MSKENLIKSQLLERAIETIEINGETAIRTHKIAADCGVTAPILYRQFGNREGLIIAAQAERYRRTFSDGSIDVATELSRRVARCLSRKDVIDTMKWFFALTMTAERQGQRLVRLEVVGSAVSRPELMREVALRDQEIITQFTNVFEVAVEHGWINSSIELNAMVSLWFGLILGRYNQEISAGFIQGDQWNKAATEAMLHLMFGEYDKV
jgi:AcrR family transcriptional regulator